jgi:aflatoxin B1 aldehyde reductase
MKSPINFKDFAANPLAGGLLTGKYKNYSDEPDNGRFTYRPNYKTRYWKKSF